MAEEDKESVQTVELMIEKIRAYNRPFVLVMYMFSIVLLSFLNVDKDTLVVYTASVGPLVGFYIGIKGKNDGNS